MINNFCFKFSLIQLETVLITAIVGDPDLNPRNGRRGLFIDPGLLVKMDNFFKKKGAGQIGSYCQL